MIHKHLLHLTPTRFLCAIALATLFSGCSNTENTEAAYSIASTAEIPSPASLTEPIPNKPSKPPTKTLPDCSSAQTQAEINTCTAEAAQKADERLNQVYRKLRAALQNSPQEQRLIAAELAWIEYRDTDCEFDQRRYDGGSIMASVYSTCVANLTEQRAEKLEQYLELLN
ncbi:DUF1311 domain-containing protein [Lusitaniella coriacea LEGE 07157]|uniref:DUF1311 domain-containing protein n=1 Tax=Lusitaniella coriacea LEGE 07157 TaxID=945747 RepID=A0A8J7AXH2_9CYAN|nr:lysozyme inhibitor LprI family protein [Lusitaniella coriacea]MBE9114479.1 DUF1311 domain-containing protein [Lusitaniella coriacea LEGE 07157]